VASTYGLPSNLYRFIQKDGEKTKAALTRIRQIRSGAFAEAAAELGLTRDTALKAVALAMEEQYDRLGRDVMVDISIKKRDEHYEYAFAAVEFIQNRKGKPDAVLIDKPLIPSPRSILQSIYQMIGQDGWRSAVGMVIGMLPGKYILRIINEDDLGGKIALLPASELGFMDDAENIHIGNRALVAVTKTEALERVTMENGTSIKPEFFATRAIIQFPQIVGPSLGIIANGYAYAGLCIYELDGRMGPRNISEAIANRDYLASALGVERIQFFHKPKSEYLDVFVRKYMKDAIGVSLTRKPRFWENRKKLNCVLYVKNQDVANAIGKNGRHLFLLSAFSGINRIKVKGGSY